jgi:hypothetical protein
VDSNGKNPTFNGGGITIQGDAAVVLAPSGAAGQIYTITQGSTTTTITIDPSAKTTLISINGKAPLTISGVPQQYDPATGGVMGYDTMLYDSGSITSLSGPGQGKAAINDGTALTITAANNVTITGDVLYKSEPVTLTASGTTAADMLIAGNNHGQALGIFTAKGDIQLSNTQSNGNLEIDASLATISQGGTGGLVNTGNAINTLVIVGGRIQNALKNINATTRNVLFDVRYANGTFSPPWFPSTSLTLGGLKSANMNAPIVQRLQWQNKTVYY